MNIVCGTDFTAHGAFGSAVAAALAGKLEDKLLLVHALPFRGRGAGFPEVSHELFARLRETLAEGAARLDQFGAEVEPHLVTDYPEPAMLSKVTPAETRLVVLASRGRAVSNHGLGSSVAERVAEHCPVPTLVVRPDDSFLQWVRGTRPLKVLCAYDFSGTADAALAYLNVLQHWGTCHFVLAQVYSPLDENGRLGFDGATSFDAHEIDVQRILERDLCEKANAVLGPASDGRMRLRVKASWGRPDPDLITMAKEEQADLIVTGTHQWHGLERLCNPSVSRALLRYAPMSVLVTPKNKMVNPIRTSVPRQVLAATDFPDAGNEAVRHAYSLLAAGGVVHLVHVIHPQALHRCEYAQRICDRHSKAQHAEYVRYCADQLCALVPADAADRGIVSKTHVIEHRAPAAAITQVAERLGADVICLGTHAVSRAVTALSGSVTRTIMNRSHRPLMVVNAAST